MKFCECGCKKEIKDHLRFFHGHNRKNKKLSEKTKQILSLQKNGKKSHSKGKTYEEIYGIEESKIQRKKRSEIQKIIQNKLEVKLKKSKSNKGKKLSKNQCEKISKAVKKMWESEDYRKKQKINKRRSGLKHSNETKKKQRIKALERIEKNYGIPIPNYTPSACEIFKKFDELHNTNGRYAVYGNGEYWIKELGYFIDYINFDLKLIIECDTPDHFDIFDNELLESIQRLKEIQEFYPDFKIYRFKPEEMYKILEIK